MSREFFDNISKFIHTKTGVKQDDIIKASIIAMASDLIDSGKIKLFLHEDSFDANGNITDASRESVAIVALTLAIRYLFTISRLN